MNTKIRQLDQQAINQIAAGEVVERPLSVVKELIENALDASAQKIEISIEGDGTPCIRIKDDGYGISHDDLPLAILPHATSKITTINDLENLHTLGFRGEALASIASVSKLSIISKIPQAIAGYEIQVEGGHLTSTSEAGCPAGTIVTVKDLFFNTPARLKFLRSASKEFGYISEMVSRFAMSRPDVSFVLRHPQNLILNTTGKGDLLEAIAAIYGNDLARRLLKISPGDDQNIQITGYLSPPDLVRSSNTAITFLLNGRVIRSKMLQQALKEGYHTLIAAGTYPIAIISLQMKPSAYDVNVHPAKTEVKFAKEQEVFQALSSVIRQTLLKAKPVRHLFQSKEPQTNNSIPIIRETMPIDKEIEPANNKDELLSQKNNWEQQKFLYRHIPDELSVQSKPFHNSLSFSEIRPIGQLFMTYILGTDERNLYIIDQHAAHERIRYEKFRAALEQGKLVSQLLLVPETVELTIQEEGILLQNLVTLQEMGFVIEHFGAKTYFLRGIPALEHLNNPGEVFRLFLDEMIEKSIPAKKDRLFEEWIFMISCRTAVKGHDLLTISEMERIIQELSQTENPLSCPHGRPTIIEVSKKELEKRFNR